MEYNEWRNRLPRNPFREITLGGTTTTSTKEGTPINTKLVFNLARDRYSGTLLGRRSSQEGGPPKKTIGFIKNLS